MSNIGKQKIIVPKGISFEIKSDINEITISSHLGRTVNTFPEEIVFDWNEKKREIGVKSDNKSLRGTIRSNLNNMIMGMSRGFQCTLKIVGVGYRASITNNLIKLKLGFSHDIEYKVPEDIRVFCPKNDTIVLFGLNKDSLFQIAAEIRSLKKPDIFKGKGIRFENEVLILKEGKKK